MKRKIQIMILAVSMLLVAGCSSNNLSDSVNDAATATNGSAVDNGSAANSGFLTVENDVFTFEQLVLLSGANEADVLELFGIAEKQDSYSIVLFGEDVSVVLTSEGDTVSAMELTFEGVERQLVENAIAEQLGHDGTSAENVVTWTYQNNTVTLADGDNGCVVTIAKA